MSRNQIKNKTSKSLSAFRKRFFFEPMQEIVDAKTFRNKD